jgi:bifunctional UDP-N-acetylglucosamine pyrophosphorylase/glucosamine-1-phosphate N-acetyltransferase
VDDPEDKRIAAVVLAAGKGTRMRSNLPKVLHPLLGRPLVLYALEAAKEACQVKPVLVLGSGAERIRQIVGDAAEIVLQEPQLGTGHAVSQASHVLKGRVDHLLVTPADMPLLRGETLGKVVQAHLGGDSATAITLLTIHSNRTRGFGRIRRDANGRIQAIVEEAGASPADLALDELNASVYCFTAAWLWEALPRIGISSAGEYYLTDLVELAVRDGYTVQTLQIEDEREAIGINNRLHLAEAESVLRQRINEAWMLAGVTVVDPQCTTIEPGVMIGQDTVIWPNTYLHGSTTIGEACEVGPNCIITDTRIGRECRIIWSVLEKAILEDRVHVGPFAHLRAGAHLAEGVHMGNFGEVKNSHLGPGTKMGHFSYVGDAAIGAGVNIGAGTITCNYDGERKHHTEIGEGAFIGSDTLLVAPVKVGEGASTGAGAVVTRNVPPNTLVVGMPARAIRKKEKRDQS